MGVALFQDDRSTLTYTVFWTITLTIFTTSTNSLHIIMSPFHSLNPLANAGSIPGSNVEQPHAWKKVGNANAGAQPQPGDSAPPPSQRQIAPLPVPGRNKSRAKKAVCPAPQAGSSTSNTLLVPTTAVPAAPQTTLNTAGPSRKRGGASNPKGAKRKVAEVEPASLTLSRPEKKGKAVHSSTTSWPAPHMIVPSMGPPLRPAFLPEAALIHQADWDHRAAVPQAVTSSAIGHAFHPSSARFSLPQGNQSTDSAIYPPVNASGSEPQSRPVQSRLCLHPRPRPRPQSRPVSASRDTPAPATGAEQRLPPPVTSAGTPVASQSFSPLLLRALPDDNALPRDASVASYGVPQGTPVAQAGPSFPVGMWREILLHALFNMTDAVYGRYWTLFAGHIMTQMARLPENHPETSDFNALVRSCSQPFPDVAQTNVAGPSQPQQYVPQQQADPAMVPRAGYNSAYGAGSAHSIGREGQLEEMDRVYLIPGAGQGGASGSGPYEDPRLGTAERPIVLDEEIYSIEDLDADA